MKPIKKPYTIRKRKDCDRYELIVRNKDFKKFNLPNSIYAGLFKTEAEAINYYNKYWKN